MFVVHAGWAKLRAGIASLTDEEYAWEPAPGAGTLGARIAHVAAGKEMSWEYAYGPAQLTWEHVNTPAGAPDCLLWLERAHELVESALAAETNLARPLLTSSGETWPAWRIFWTLAENDITRAAEFATLRELRRAAIRV